MPVPRIRRYLLIAAVALVAVLALAALLARRHVDRTLSTAASQMRDAHQLAFTLRAFSQLANPGFTSVLPRADLRWGATSNSELFLAGPGRVLEFTMQGTPVRSFTSGIDLPGVPITGVLSGRLHDGRAADVLIATAGAGVLILQPLSGKVEQLLPTNPEMRDITALAVLPEGDLLLGTRRSGVLRFDGESLTLYRPEHLRAAVTSLAADAEGVWVGTQADGLLRTRGGVTTRLQADLPDLHIAALTTRGDEVFAATPNGVVELHEGKVLRVLAAGTFAQALAADDRELTMALFEGGTATVGLNAGHVHAPAMAQEGGEATRQFLRMGDALYGVRPDGLYRRGAALWSPVVSVASVRLTDNNVAALGFDPDGRLWVGSFDRGLDVVSASGDAVRHLEDDHLFCINRIALDPARQTMAVATANGLVLFDRAGTPRQVLATHDGLISEHVTDVAWSPGVSGDTMVIATPAGLTFVGRDGVESLYAFQGLVNNHVYSVAFSPDGGLLAGTLGGLSMLEHGAVRRNVSAGNSELRRNWISAVLPLPAFAGGGSLLGTYGGGLMRITASGQITGMPGAPEGVVINPNALLASATHVFAGTLNDGLWVYGRSSGRWQQVIAGLPSQNVTALAAHGGELFVGTDNGLVKIAEAQLPQ